MRFLNLQQQAELKPRFKYQVTTIVDLILETLSLSLFNI